MGAFKYNLYMFSGWFFTTLGAMIVYWISYQIYVDEISTLVSLHKLFLSQWLPEKENLGAHNLALQALK